MQLYVNKLDNLDERTKSQKLTKEETDVNIPIISRNNKFANLKTSHK